MSYQNDKFIRDHGLTEAVKRFQQITEYTFVTKKPTITEEGDEDDNNQQRPMNNQQMPQQNGNNADMNNMGGNPMQGNGQTNMGNANANMNGNANMQATPDMGNNSQQQGMDMNTDPNMNMDGGDTGFEDINMEGEPENDDEVIDVDDLTKSQENSEFKIEQMQSKLDDLAQLTQSFLDAINASDAHIEDLKAEIEQRMPTDKEKLNLRSQAGAPFSENPTEYWQDKAETNPNYEVSFDNADPAAETKPIEIKMSEITSAPDKEVYDSFNKMKSLTDYVKF